MTIIKTVWARNNDPRAREIVTLRTFSGAVVRTRHVVDLEINLEELGEFERWLAEYTPRHLHGKHINFGDLQCYSGFTLGERQLIDAYNHRPEFRDEAVARVERMLACYGSAADEPECIFWDWGQLKLGESGVEFITRNAKLMRDVGITKCAVKTNAFPSITNNYYLYDK